MNLTELVKASGIVGAGGAGFPTHVKLNAKAECFVVNAAECEPYITSDHRLLLERPEETIGGLQYDFSLADRDKAMHSGVIARTIVLDRLVKAYLAAHPETRIDYVHGEQAARDLGSKPGNLALLMPPFDKSSLYDIVRHDGVLVRKSFSLGEAPDKRFYLEARKITR